MTIREIPRSFEYTCDMCGAIHIQENAGGQYTDSRPPGWARLIFKGGLVDTSGQEHDASQETLMCPNCRETMVKALYSVRALRKGG